MDNLNAIPMGILKELVFHPKSRFSQLNKDKVSSDQFAYHLKVLQELKLIEKSGDKYSLSIEGKEFASRMDVNEKKLEKQPKVSVFIIPVKEVKGIKKYLISIRNKEPYFGYMGFITGKVKYGETVEEAASRELKDETNLEGKFKTSYVLHEMVYTLKHEILEDKFFIVIEAFDIKGKVINEQGMKSKWMTEREFFDASPKFHSEEEIFLWYKENDFKFKEKKYYIQSF